MHNWWIGHVQSQKCEDLCCEGGQVFYEVSCEAKIRDAPAGCCGGDFDAKLPGKDRI